MKTGRSKAGTIVFKDMNTSSVSSKQMMKKHTTGVVTEACGDKENVVEGTHAAVGVTELTKSKVVEAISDVKDKNKRATVAVENVTDKKKAQMSASCEEKIQITADDLTNPAGPSEKYWQLVAEQRRKALKDTLNENEMLHKKCELLEAENETLKEALQEATEIINVLNEIVAEEKEADQTGTEPGNQSSTSPVKEKPKSPEYAFGNESTVLDESDDSDKE